MTDEQRIKLYLAELVQLGRKHGVVLMHQDHHGAFEVLLDPSNGVRVSHEDWVMAAKLADGERQSPQPFDWKKPHTFVITGKNTLSGDLPLV